MTKLLQNKRGLIMGVANDHSIAWGIAREMAAQGAETGIHLSKRWFEKADYPFNAKHWDERAGRGGCARRCLHGQTLSRP